MPAAEARKPNDLMGLFDPPDHAQEAIRALVRELYGIDADIAPLAGERDQNVLVCAEGLPRSVLKISHPKETETYTEYQSKILLHLQQTAPDLPVPRIVPTRNGHPYSHFEFSDGQRCAVKMVTFLAGRPLPHSSRHLATWARRVGVMQAKICNALADFDHPGSKAFIPWNATSDTVLNNQILALLGSEFRDLVAPHLNRLQTVSLPSLQNMRSQIIHNDIHTGNVLLDDRENISGVIDFGDAIHAPIIQEIAVSAVSLMEMGPDEPFQVIEQLVHGFCSECPLDAGEHTFLHDAMLLRSVLNVALGRLKDLTVPEDQRPHPATRASQEALTRLVAMREVGCIEVSVQ